MKVIGEVHQLLAPTFFIIFTGESVIYEPHP